MCYIYIMREFIKKAKQPIKKYRFQQFCKKNNLNLSYKLNQEGLEILNEVFHKREYADYFPFYEKVTIIDIGAHMGYFFASLQALLNKHIQCLLYVTILLNFLG